jgi:hypothetical protein
MGLVPTPCPTQFPDDIPCGEISFTFPGVRNTIGDATLTYMYKNDDQGNYQLSAGTSTFNENALAPTTETCEVFQQVEVKRSADEFNSEDKVIYIKQGEVLNVNMEYQYLDANTCANTTNTAKIRLQYNYFNCGE